jgi:ABC-type sugar transport system substrate-binding protein
MVVPIDANAIVPAIKAANDRHVPVVSVAEVPQGGKVYVTVNGDNVAMGASACQTIGQRLNGKGAVLELYGTLSSSNGRDRHQGFLDCMKSRYPGIEVVSKPTEWEAAEATDAAQTVLSTRKIDGIYTASDSVMGPGVTKVLQDQGKLKPVGEPGHVVTVSVDGTPFALRQVRDGYQDAVVSQPLDLFAKYGVSYVADALAGKPVLPGPTDHGSKVVESNGNLVDLLPSPVVTKANVEDQTLWGNQS